MDTHYKVIVLALILSVLFPSCLLIIFTFTAPTEATVGEPFNVVITGSLTGKGPSANGIVMQIPKEWKVNSAVYHSNYGDGKLIRSRYLESLYRAESGYYVYAAYDSTSRSETESGAVQVIVTIVPRTTGSFTLKLVTGGTDSSTALDNWQSCDPKQVYDFANVEDGKHIVATTVTEPRYSGSNAIALDGVEDYLTIPQLPGISFSSQDNFTIECWLKTTATNMVVFSKRDAAQLSKPRETGIPLEWDKSNTTPYPYELSINKYGLPIVTASDGVLLKSIAGDFFVADGLWHHVAVTNNGQSSLLKLYIDGICTDSTVAKLGENRNTKPVIIGSRMGKENFFAGSLDELRIWSVERSEKEIQGWMNTSITSKEKGLIALYHFDEPTWSTGKVAKNAQGDENLNAVLHGSPVFVSSTAPVFLELLFFTADILGNTIELRWATGNETNLKGFLLEKRVESEPYRELAFQPAVKSNLRQKAYSFTDVVTPDNAGVFYYRLKQLNNDGTFRYSDEIKVGTGLVKDFILEQNYPNPFNLKTSISYTLLADTYVLLRVFDLVGQEIAVLVNKKQSAGRYSVDFEGTNLTSGIYIYKLQTEHFYETRKMVLAK